MRKKIVYIGLLLVFGSIAVALISGSLINANIQKKLIPINLTVGSANFSFAMITAMNSSLIVYGLLSSPTNIYMMNSSIFQKWSNSIVGNKSRSGLAYAQNLITNKTLLIKNSSVSAFAIIGNSSAFLTAPKVLTAYVVIDNTKGSNSTNAQVQARLAYLLTSSIKDQQSSILGTAALFIFMLIGGIATIIYGIFKKSPPEEGVAAAGTPKKGEVSKEYIDSLYKGIGKGKR